MATLEAVFEQLVFVQVSVVWFLLCGLLFALTFLVGPRLGAHAAKRYQNFIGVVFLLGAVLIAFFGVATHEMLLMIELIGLPGLLNPFFIGVVWIVFMWFISNSYVRKRLRKEEMRAGFNQKTWE